MASDNQLLWVPGHDRQDGHQLDEFREAFAELLGQPISDYEGLHSASIVHRDVFWSLVWDQLGVIGDKAEVVLGRDIMPGAEFFPDAKLNFAENLLVGDDARIALVFRAEDKIERQMTLGELRRFVSHAQQWLLAEGVRSGDRVAAMLPNMPEAIGMMLATASIGAIWSSCSPDFGPRGVLDRFGQKGPLCAN